MLGLPQVKTCGQEDLNSDGFADWDSETEKFLSRNYGDFICPTKTHMVPPVFESKHRRSGADNGDKTEKSFFDLLQKFGESREQLGEGMFIVHSYNFKEMISDWNEKKTKLEMKWVLGEHDFVLLHPIKGIVFFQVKASCTTKEKFSEANKQIDKDMESLRAFAAANLPKAMQKKVNKMLHCRPGFVVMPNCPRPNSQQMPSNGIFKEDCETVESFANWWDWKSNGMVKVDQELFKCLVMRFVGMLHSIPPLSHFIDTSYRRLAFKTNEQLEVMLNSTSEQWVTGPAGSGKTWLLMEKVKSLAQKIHLQETGERILVCCFNLPLSKMLRKAFQNHLKSLLPEDDLSQVVDVKTFSSLLYEITGKYGKTDAEKKEIVEAAVKRLDEGAPAVQRYDHIFVDECQDLFGDRWLSLFDKLCKDDGEKYEGCEPNHKWFFYDPNQHLGLSEKRYQKHKKYLKKSTKLSKVLRNTGNVFDQSKKYFQSKLQSGDPIKLGHREWGLSIEWDSSLRNRKISERDGAESILIHVNELLKNKVQRKDICVLVGNLETRDKLTAELKLLGEDCQDAERLQEANDDKVVVESIWRFKGLEAKVVVLYNPRYIVYKDWNVSNVKELLYTAVSRCFCYLIVVTTKEGYKALTSNDGIVERTKRKRQDSATPSRGLENEPRSQMKVFLSGTYEKGNLDTEYESGPPEYASPNDSSEEDDESEQEEATQPLVKVSRLGEEQCIGQYKKSAKSRLPKLTRPIEVDGSDIFEPGDPDIKDPIRKQVLKPLGVEVEKNLQYIPGCSATNPAEIGSKIVKTIEYEVYCKFRNDGSSVNYTKELRGLKKEIVSCNGKEQGHERVEKTVKQTKFNSAELQAQP